MCAGLITGLLKRFTLGKKNKEMKKVSQKLMTIQNKK